MKVDPIRLKKQQEICSAWIQAGARGTLQAVTGFGKTNVGMLLMESQNARHPDRTTKVVVPTLVLKAQWEEEIAQRKIKNATVQVINTAIKSIDKVNLLILDELHRYAADTFKNVFKAVQYDFLLGLTATLARSDGRHELLKAYAPIIATVGMKEARANGWISEYMVFSLGIPLPPTEKAAYDGMNKQFNRFFAQFGHDFNLAMSCLSDPLARRRVALENGWEDREVQIAAVNFSRYLHKRKKFVNTHPMKLWYAKQIVEKFPSANMLIFSETTDFADEMAKMIGEDICAPFHSKITKKNLNDTLNRFKDKRTKLRILSTARALDEGFNVEGIDFAIICSGNSTARQAIQRIGRSIRFKEGKRAHIVNLFIEETQDEKWTQSRLESIPNVHWIKDVEEIDYEYIEERDAEPEETRVNIELDNCEGDSDEIVYAFAPTPKLDRH